MIEPNPEKVEATLKEFYLGTTEPPWVNDLFSDAYRPEPKDNKEAVDPPPEAAQSTGA